MTLRTRKPTGAVPWPLILLEGGEKSGKSWACAELSTSDRIGQMYWIDLGEGSADEYGAIPGADYLIIEHDGSFASLYTAVEEIHRIAGHAAAKGEKPVVLTIDSMTAEWDLLKDWAANRAKGSKTNRKRLAEDPNAEIVIATNYWNDANSRHARLMRLLMTFPGIVLLTARGKDIALIGDDGKPVEGKKSYRVEGHKNLAFDSSCWVRLSRESKAIVVGARSVHTGIRPGRDEPQTLQDDWSLEWLIFEALRCDPAKAHVRDLVEAKPERTPEQIRDEAMQSTTSSARMRELWEEAKQFGYGGVTVDNENGQEELLSQLLARLGAARKAGEPATEEQHAQMDALWQQVEISDEGERLQFTGEIIGREISSSSELTGAEAVMVIKRLDGYAKQSQPQVGAAA
ncbi:hypothetical protein [Microbispora sp. KK1-11]|uniref:hypothetical protein n=1 Tax=Microbispora sp. KK1-11 TaxID=2053005 RepID=UPI001158F0B8|nr:hypothetical protein [Microbispora sp. KK1-11]TQS30007.1 hypothetical protein FLW16_06500 [Microbispora sp. KK1-11]